MSRQLPDGEEWIPWDKRLPGETAPSYRKFCEYLALGYSRSLAKMARAALAGAYGLSPKGYSLGNLELLSRRHKWTARCAGYELAQGEKMVREWEERRRAYLEVLYDLSRDLMGKALEIVREPLRARSIETVTVGEDGELTQSVEIVEPAAWRMGDAPRLALAGGKLGEVALLHLHAIMLEHSQRRNQSSGDDETELPGLRILPPSEPGGPGGGTGGGGGEGGG